ncbi:bacterial transcriptional activator domain-containing protein [Pseudarthrobacter sp. H3Y2-7]|uniref:AfsR/SARP family transcriptional regulator n=1 Tax=Pseudarthrobacter naphthalenicus TaxID=3031328 RepID=UPI0023B1B349|nr:bacterial transcriptional activator domain-containing protein [Pseudarthrobacter sp. H3Y2-7]MDE8668420.1 bacterial transcriptional activator domain-containing protein [Pseudarthrobacter sp. H3Y2-7]
METDVNKFRDTAKAVCSRLRPIREVPVEEILACQELLTGMYDDWLVFEREKYRQMLLHALEAASASLLEASAFAAALETALAAVSIEPLRESANTAVISVHLRENNLIEAVRHYEYFHNLIFSELGVAPSPAMQALLPRGCRIYKK